MLTQLWELFVDLWETGNWWARAVLSAFLIYPLSLVILAYVGIDLTLATITLVLLVMFAFALIAYVDPIIVGIVAAHSQGRTFLKFIAVLIAVESLIGAFFSVLPASTNPNLSSLLLLVVICVGLLSTAISSSLEVFAKKMTRILVVVGSLIVLVLCAWALAPEVLNELGGARKHVMGKAASWVRNISRPDTSKASSAAMQRSRPVVWHPEPFPLPEPGKFVPTVTNLDTANLRPASYKIWAKKGDKMVKYRVSLTNPKTNERVEREMPATPKYFYGAAGGIGHLAVAAKDSGTVFWAERVM